MKKILVVNQGYNKKSEMLSTGNILNHLGTVRTYLLKKNFIQK